MRNSTIKDCIMDGVGIQITAANLYFEHMLMTNMSTSNDNLPIIQASLESYMYINDTIYTSSTAPFFNVLTSVGDVSFIDVQNYRSNQFLLKYEKANNGTLTDWKLKNITIVTSVPILFADSYIHSIERMEFDTASLIFFRIQYSHIRLMDSMNIINSRTGPFYIISSNIDMLSNSNFADNGISFVIIGTIWTRDTNMTIVNTTFTGNKGRNGGGLQLYCKTTLFWQTVLTNVTFTGNNATTQGGAIYYDLYRPVMNNVVFTNNDAPHGPDIASYPVKIVQTATNETAISLSNIASGQVADKILTFSVVDHDNQISSDTSGGRISISPVNPSTSVLGTSSASIVEGSANFTGLVFKATPGSEDVEFRVSSSTIDSTKLLKQYGRTSIQDPMTVSFRKCKPGEYQVEGICSECIGGTYSVTWDARECKSWPEFMSCLGGTQLHVDKGYWRQSLNSTVAIEWLRETACNGGYEPDNLFPVECASGYEGKLCTECQIVDGEKYERLTNYECSKCPDLVYNAIRIAGLMLLVSIFFIGIIAVGIKKKKESQQSILLRILTNYLQLLTAALSYDMSFPKALTDMMSPVQSVGASSEAFLSVDWFFRDTEIKGFTPSNAIFKTFLTGLLPLFLIMLAVIVWGILRFVHKKWFGDFYRNVVVTTVIIIFLLHPTLTKVGLELFQWVQVDDDEFRVRIDLDIMCYSWEHIQWCLYICLPIIMVWVIGCPLLMGIVLFRNRHDLNKPHMQRYFLMIYQGLREKVFYWELVNTLRKVSMVAINVFMSTVPLMYAAATAVLVLIFLIRVQMKLNPYKLDLNNKLEIDAMVTGGSTLFCGILFVSDDNDIAFVILLILIVIVALNIKFMMHWCFWMSFTLAHKYKTCHSIFMMLGVALMKRNQAEKMLEESGIEYVGTGNDKSDVYSVPQRHKKKVDIKSASLKRIRKKSNDKMRRKKSKYMKNESMRKINIDTKSRKKVKGAKSIIPPETVIYSAEPSIPPTDNNSPRNTTIIGQMTTQQRMQKLKVDMNDVDRLVIVENDSNKDNSLGGAFGLKRDLSENQVRNSTDTFDLFTVKKVKKDRKVNLDNIANAGRENDALDILEESKDSIAPSSKAMMYSKDKKSTMRKHF